MNKSDFYIIYLWRMYDVEEMLREMSEKYKNSKSIEVYEEQLEGWFKLIDDLREENRKLREEIGKLGLHIKAKDEAYIKLLKDYEKLKESSETKEETLINAIGDIFNKLKD